MDNPLFSTIFGVEARFAVYKLLRNRHPAAACVVSGNLQEGAWITQVICGKTSPRDRHLHDPAWRICPAGL